MADKFNNNEIKADVQLFRQVQQALIRVTVICNIKIVVNNNEKCDFSMY
jgi:hypothetical protein